MKRIARTLRLLGALLAGGATSLSFGSLRWETTTMERVLPVGVDLVEIKFALSNPGKKPVTILHVVPGCGCTTTTLEKNTFAPGEKGRLTVLFDGKNLSGEQVKTIQVVTDDESTPTPLTLRVTIPEWLLVSTRVLAWKIGEETKPKEALVTLPPDVDLKLTGMKTDGPAITATLQPEKDSKRYRLIATPTSTQTPVRVGIMLSAEIPGSSPRTLVLVAEVR